MDYKINKEDGYSSKVEGVGNAKMSKSTNSNIPGKGKMSAEPTEANPENKANWGH